MNDNGQPEPEQTTLQKHWQGFVVILLALAILGGIIAGIFTAGERHVINGLLKEGLRVTVNRSAAPGEGRYTVQVWERGTGGCRSIDEVAIPTHSLCQSRRGAQHDETKKISAMAGNPSAFDFRDEHSGSRGNSYTN